MMKILVIGDFIVDKFTHVNMTKLSQEAPIPVFQKVKTVYRLGGAANVALNCHLHADTTLYSAAVTYPSVPYKFVNLGGKTLTTTKERFMVNDRQVFRYDDEVYEPINTDEIQTEDYDIILISDYDKGMIHNPRKILQTAKCPIIIDPKGHNWSKYTGAYCITPNRNEFEEACGPLNLKNIRAAIKRYSLKAMLITLGKDGAWWVTLKYDIHLPSLATIVTDVTGAGDTFIALFAVHFDERNIRNSLDIANKAAAIAVGKVGTYAVTKEDIMGFTVTQEGCHNSGVNKLDQELENERTNNVEARKGIIKKIQEEIHDHTANDGSKTSKRDELTLKSNQIKCISKEGAHPCASIKKLDDDTVKRNLIGTKDDDFIGSNFNSFRYERSSLNECDKLKNKMLNDPETVYVDDQCQLGCDRKVVENKIIVFTNGCFDIFHTNHLRFLKEARSLGDKLIVALNSDASVERIKRKPIIGQLRRKELLEGLSCVDEVIIFDEDTPWNLIRKIKPDILVKGGDYKEEDVVGTDLVDKVVLIPIVDKNVSTTAIIKQIQARVHTEPKADCQNRLHSTALQMSRSLHGNTMNPVITPNENNCSLIYLNWLEPKLHNGHLAAPMHSMKPKEGTTRLQGKVNKKWGHENILVSNDFYCAKILHFNGGGNKCSMHFHTDKRETWYVLNGSFEVTCIQTKDATKVTTRLLPGSIWNNDVMVPHQLVALENQSQILEVSTPDSVEDNYRVGAGDSQKLEVSTPESVEDNFRVVAGDSQEGI